MTVNIIRGHPSPVSSLLAPVKFAITFGIQQSTVQFKGSLPAFHAMVPSTKYSGIVWTIATIARASPLLIENSEASAAHAMRREAAMTAPKVKKATVYVDWRNSRTTRMEMVAQAMRSEYSARILRCTSQSSRNQTWRPRPLGDLGSDGQDSVEYSSSTLRPCSRIELERAEAGVMVLFLFCMVHRYGVGEDQVGVEGLVLDLDAV